MKTRTTQINRLILQDKWAQAEQLIKRHLRREPDSHWLLTRLSLTYYERRQYKKALSLSQQALSLSPKCPLVLWDYAGCLDMLGKELSAISVWKSLIRRGVVNIAGGKCGEGISWARMLVNDCRYRIGKTFHQIRNSHAAAPYIRQYLRYRKVGVGSIYSTKDAKLLLTAINASSPGAKRDPE